MVRMAKVMKAEKSRTPLGAKARPRRSALRVYFRLGLMNLTYLCERLRAVSSCVRLDLMSRCKGILRRHGYGARSLQHAGMNSILESDELSLNRRFD